MSSLIGLLDIFDECRSDAEILKLARPNILLAMNDDRFRAAVNGLRSDSLGTNEIVTMFDGLKFDILEAKNDRTSVLLELRTAVGHIASSSNNAIVTLVHGDLPIWVDEFAVTGITDDRDLPIALGLAPIRSFLVSSGESFIIRAGLSAHRIREIATPVILHRLNAAHTSHFNHYFNYPSLAYTHSSFADQARTRDYFYFCAINSIIASLPKEEDLSFPLDALSAALISSMGDAARSNDVDAVSRWKAIQTLGLVDREHAMSALGDLSRSRLHRLSEKASETLKAFA